MAARREGIVRELVRKLLHIYMRCRGVANSQGSNIAWNLLAPLKNK